MHTPDIQRATTIVAFAVLLVPAGLIAAEPASDQSDRVSKVLLMDRHAVGTLHEEVAADLAGTEVFDDFGGGERPVLVVVPFDVHTSDEIPVPASALRSQLETFLVNNAPVDVVNLASQRALLEERRRHPDYEADEDGGDGIAALADLRLDGKVYADRRETSQGTQVTYRLVVEITDADTDDLVFRSTSSVTRTTAKPGDR